MNFQHILAEQYRLYPKMQPQDFVKLAYQKEFGGGHLIEDEDKSLEHLEKEVQGIPERTMKPLFEGIGNNFFRLNLDSRERKGIELSTIHRIFLGSAHLAHGNRRSFEDTLDELRDFCIQHPLSFTIKELDDYLEGYKAQGYPAVHHSDLFRRAYQPHYRIIHGDYQAFFQIFCEIDALLGQKPLVKVAIDGMSASGKTTLSHRLGSIYDCPVFHMDDFFLTPALRTPERLKEVGGNVDYERFHREILGNIHPQRSFRYQIYHCKTNTFTPSEEIGPKRLYIIEGAYSMHPSLIQEYDLKIFLSIDPQKQGERIRKRNGEKAYERFIHEWIPKENAYIEKMGIQAQSDLSYRIE